MAKIFQTIPSNRPKRNSFDLSHERKMSINMGDLVPCMLQEVIPGDNFRVKMEHLIRFQPLLAPMMHRVNVYTHFFFVPHRLVWNEFEKFITGGEDGQQSPSFPKIKFNFTHGNLVKPGCLMDYMGVPCSNYEPTFDPFVEISALPFRAYQLIYNEYYRDQNLTPPVDFDRSSGIVAGDTKISELVTLRKRAWEKDYFTSALPWAQRGAQLTIPLSGQADVVSNGENPKLVSQVTGFPWNSNPIKTDGSGGLEEQTTESPFKWGDETGLETDLSSVSSSTINELRQAFQIQKWLERSARGGARYIEQILSHFGVLSSDARLQRPEYLGGGKTPVVISEVLQTSATEVDSPQGTMAGHGISVGSSNQFSKSFEEHGYVIGIMSVLPRTSYQNGLPRHLQKFDKFDYYWPEFAHIGEQPVYKNEIYNDFTHYTDGNNRETFGYQARYSEYRYAPDTVHGDFATNLDFWHMGRKFTSTPPLNTSFVTSDPTHRIFAVTDSTEHKLLVQTYVDFKAIRPIAKYGEPLGI